MQVSRAGESGIFGRRVLSARLVSCAFYRSAFTEFSGLDRIEAAGFGRIGIRRRCDREILNGRQAPDQGTGAKKLLSTSRRSLPSALSTTMRIGFLPWTLAGALTVSGMFRISSAAA